MINLNRRSYDEFLKRSPEEIEQALEKVLEEFCTLAEKEVDKETQLKTQIFDLVNENIRQKNKKQSEAASALQHSQREISDQLLTVTHSDAKSIVPKVIRNYVLDDEKFSARSAGLVNTVGLEHLSDIVSDGETQRTAVQEPVVDTESNGICYVRTTEDVKQIVSMSISLDQPLDISNCSTSARELTMNNVIVGEGNIIRGEGNCTAGADQNMFNASQCENGYHLFAGVEPHIDEISQFKTTERPVEEIGAGLTVNWSDHTSNILGSSDECAGQLIDYAVEIPSQSTSVLEASEAVAIGDGSTANLMKANVVKLDKCKEEKKSTKIRVVEVAPVRKSSRAVKPNSFYDDRDEEARKVIRKQEQKMEDLKQSENLEKLVEARTQKFVPDKKNAIKEPRKRKPEISEVNISELEMRRTQLIDTKLPALIRIFAGNRHEPFMIRAVGLLSRVSPHLRCIFLTAIATVFYYSKFRHRINLTAKWKGFQKVDKIEASVRVWLQLLGMESQSQEDFLCKSIKEFLIECWL